MSREIDPDDVNACGRDHTIDDARNLATGIDDRALGRSGDSIDPRDTFNLDLDLPRTARREFVYSLERQYELSARDVQTLATAGAFRLIPEQDLTDAHSSGLHVREADLLHLEKQGLIQRVPINEKDRAVTLTSCGRALLERHRDPDVADRQQFYSGADRPRERSHDAQFYRAYLEAAERLRDRGARIERVQLDRELKRDYQRFLQERNRGDHDSDGRSDRIEAEIAAWAREHNLAYFDDQVHFPDVRIEYEDANGDVRFEDIEVVTEHYRGAHRASAARCGFSTYVSRRSGGGAFNPRVAEDFV